MAAGSDAAALDTLHIRLGLDHDPHRMATETVAAMTDHAQTVQKIPTPSTLAEGHGRQDNWARLHLHGVKAEHEADFRKELRRITRLPPLSVINTIYAAACGVQTGNSGPTPPPSPDQDKFGNNNGSLVPEQADPADAFSGLGSWDKSAVWAKFYLSAELRTCGRHLRYVYQEVFPWESYPNLDSSLGGYLVMDKHPPPPPPPPPPTQPSEQKEDAVSLTTPDSKCGSTAHTLQEKAPPSTTASPMARSAVEDKAVAQGPETSQPESHGEPAQLPHIWGETPTSPATNQALTSSAQTQPPPAQSQGAPPVPPPMAHGSDQERPAFEL
ncbi:unnamed protein product [Symbiodinium sp. CCMP2592]|nr:unnamed protein product [Symbiodinium sp. CCMP2592]